MQRYKNTKEFYEHITNELKSTSASKYYNPPTVNQYYKTRWCHSYRFNKF